MKLILLIVINLIICADVFSQQKVLRQIAHEDFTENHWGWSIINRPNLDQAFINSKGQYVLDMPLNSRFGGFTFFGLPNTINQFNTFIDSELNFEYLVTNKDPKQDIFSLGLIFDFHNQTEECPGGDFYLLRIEGSIRKKVIYANITQRKKCSYVNVDNPIIPSKSPAGLLDDFNKISIKKFNSKYDVYINDINVLTFEYKGKLSLKRIYIENGNRHILDNFTINEVNYIDKPSEDRPIIKPQSPSKVRPNIYVLLVGIDEYDFPGYKLDALKSCEYDAQSMYNFWTSTNGGKIDKKNIVLLKGRQATTDAILESSKKLFSNATERDVIITYLSGHGANGAFSAYNGSLSYNWINPIISESKAANKLMIVDACHAGSWNVNPILTKKGGRVTEDEALQLFYDNLSSSAKSINWLLACAPNEVSMAGGENENSEFTKVLLKGLKGQADLVSDNIIFLRELYEFMETEFEVWNKKFENQRYNTGELIKQTPQLKGNGNDKMPVAVIFK